MNDFLTGCIKCLILITTVSMFYAIVVLRYGVEDRGARSVITTVSIEKKVHPDFVEEEESSEFIDLSKIRDTISSDNDFEYIERNDKKFYPPCENYTSRLDVGIYGIERYKEMQGLGDYNVYLLSEKDIDSEIVYTFVVDYNHIVNISILKDINWWRADEEISEDNKVRLKYGIPASELSDEDRGNYSNMAGIQKDKLISVREYGCCYLIFYSSDVNYIEYQKYDKEKKMITDFGNVEDDQLITRRK